jgi:AraC family transcriptional regulator
MESCMEVATANEVRYAPKTVLPNHIHEKPYFCAVLKGSYVGKYGSKFQEGHAAETVFRPAGETHTVRFHDTEARLLRIELPRRLMQRAAEFCRGLEVSSNFVSGRLTWLAKRVWGENQLSDPCSQLAVEGLLLEMLAEVSKQGAPRVARVPPWLLRIKKQIEETSVDGLSVEGLARSANVHPVYLITAFKRAFRSTPGEFQRQMRVRKAEELMMKAPEMPLSEIALATGFFDQSHFCRAFKQVACVTPSRFRQDHYRS